MSTPVLIGIIVGVLAIGGLLGAAVLFGLASGDSGPRRFGVTMPDTDFFDKTASFAVTAQISVPGPVERVWTQVSEGGYLESIPFVSGPVRSGDHVVTRTPLFAITEKVVHSEEGLKLVAIGTGISVPLVLKSFGERWELAAEGNKVLVRWTVAVTPKWVGWFPLRWTAFAVRPFLRTLLFLAIR
ncbi:SRPBCC family protein [Mycobacterium sp. D16R24]|uniref:SRPBCC family protein n=1 Tax=Mycobacterium sp. D16R24 TaxID=1855656 RepID=UPI0009919A87|nr:SRPBCC family protein [Mycobacterium sp. D16R24]